MRWAAIIVCGVLAACTAPEDNPTRTVNGVLEVQIVDGWNCFGGRCLNYHEAIDKISVVGRLRVAVPNRIALDDGYVTEREYQTLIWVADRADWIDEPPFL